MRVALVLLAACGRLGFDGTTARDATDAAPGCGLACDGFESGSGLDPRWMTDTFHGSLGLDATHVHSGSQAVHVHTNAIASSTTDPRATLLSYTGLPITGTLYVRAWVYFASPQPGVVFDQIINVADDPGNGISLGTKNTVLANNDYTSGGYTESATTFPLDRWACLMLAIPSGTTGSSRIFLDGSELTDATIPVTVTQPAPTHIYLGIEWVGTVTNQAAADAWIDDVVIDTMQPGC